jgi:hypothetical protein
VVEILAGELDSGEALRNVMEQSATVVLRDYFIKIKNPNQFCG